MRDDAGPYLGVLALFVNGFVWVGRDESSLK
jgi:hypothetical protein